MQAPNQQPNVPQSQNPRPLIRPRAGFGRQLWTMLRHNVQLKGRSRKSLACEVIVPFMFLFQLVFFGFVIPNLKTVYPAIYYFNPEKLSHVQHEGSSEMVGFTPDNSHTQSFARAMKLKWMKKTEFKNQMHLKSFDSDAEMENYFHHTAIQIEGNATARMLARSAVGIVFNDPELTTLNYTLRFPYFGVPRTSPPYISNSDTCQQDKTKKKDDDLDPNEQNTPTGCDATRYVTNGFLALQTHIAEAYIELSSKKKLTSITFTTQLMPQLASESLGAAESIAIVPAMCMTIILGTFVCFLVSCVVAETEARLLSNMQVMGLRPSVYWISWTLLYFIVLFVMSLICVVALKVIKLWSRSNVLLTLLYCLLYSLAMIAVAWCVVPVIRRPLVACLFLFLVVFVGSFLSIIDDISSLTDEDRWGLGFMPSGIFAIGISRITKTEFQGFGVGFDNVLPKLGYSIGSIFFSLLIDVVVFGLLAVYLEQVFPSDDKVKQRPWFFVLPSYWVKSKQDPLATAAIVTNIDMEPIPPELRQKTAIVTRNLRKDFHTKVGSAAVEGFTYEIYEDEILAVLGHNGAGKTTLLSMLVGLLKPTSGKAWIYGQDITDAQQLKIAQTMIGICPQHDVLFDTLTVKEHIIFYARLKGFKDEEAEHEYNRIIDCIDMRGQATNKSQNLSGGQKRRLSIAIAIVGDPKVLMLDEPTSGVDPFSRSFLWDMIRSFKKGRCVIVTTHSMQEADIHCDRKLIFSHGQIRCAGSSMFLKNRFGAGYHLTMSVDREFNENQVTEFVTSRIPNAKTARVHGGEISFNLPKDAATKFQKLFGDLDKSQASLHIRSYGIAETSLEEIFLKLAEDSAPHDVPLGDSSSMVKVDLKSSAVVPATRLTSPKKGAVSYGTKFLKLCKIRFLLALRSKLTLTLLFFLPLILLILIGVLLKVMKDEGARSAMANYLPMKKIQADLDRTGVPPASSDNAEENTVVGHLEALVYEKSKKKLKFDQLLYKELNQSLPHYISFEFPVLDKKTEAMVAAATSMGFTVPRPAQLVFNSSVKHILPYATNLLLNAVYRDITGKDETFGFAMHPFADPVEKAKKEAGGTGLESFLLGLTLLLIPGLFCVDVCRDRTLKLRSQIRMTGCSMWLYWASAFFSHFVQFWVTFVLTIILMYAFKVTDFTDNMGPIIVLFLLHAAAVILFCYCLAFGFKKHTTAMAAVPFPLALAGVLVHLIVMIVTAVIKEKRRESSNPDGPDLTYIPHYVCVFMFPFYGLFAGLDKLAKIKYTNEVAKAMEQPELTGFDWKTDVPIVYVAHVVHIALYALLLTYLESVSFNQTWLQTIGLSTGGANSRKDDNNNAERHPLVNVEDEDVMKELQRAQTVNEQQGSLYSLLTRNLWKQYGGTSVVGRGCRKCMGNEQKIQPPKQVVRNVSILLPKGEILGLLGPNGAGKSTTLSMIVGEVTPTSGNVYVTGHHMRSDTAAAIESMGSCPQTDTLWDDIKMSEHLELFAALNDLPGEEAIYTSNYFVNGLAIKEHLPKKAAALSGGTKRKLTFMISMLGSPPLVLLDEPSTGMDPQSKRFLWDIITQNFGGERSAVLTTHSMEEADALCDRICIIVNGTMHCIGSSQHLKDRYGSGYILEIRISVPPSTSPPGTVLNAPLPTLPNYSPNPGAPPVYTPPPPTASEAAQQKAKVEVLKMFPKATCTEQQYNRMVFTIGRDQIASLGAVFADLDKLKQTLNLEEYSFSQTTLEQVFLHFAAKQESQTDRQNKFPQFQPMAPPFAGNQISPSPYNNGYQQNPAITAQPSYYQQPPSHA